jgi:hypothetical protein
MASVQGMDNSLTSHREGAQRYKWPARVG